MGDWTMSRVLGLFWITLLVVFLVRYNMKRQRLKSESSSDKDLIEDQNLLSQAEQDVKNVDLKKEISLNYDFFDSYSTMQGFNEDYINKLIKVLEENKIQAVFMFIASGPAGMMRFAVDGTFELYVQKNKTKEAAEIIKNFLPK